MIKYNALKSTNLLNSEIFDIDAFILSKWLIKPKENTKMLYFRELFIIINANITVFQTYEKINKWICKNRYHKKKILFNPPISNFMQIY